MTDKNQSGLPFAEYTVEHASEAIFWVGSDARFLRVNQAACDHLGYTREELLRMTIDQIAPDYPSERWPQFWEHAQSEKQLTMESRHRRKDGAMIPIEITINILEFDGEKFMVSFVRDISQSKRTREEINSLAKFPGENPNPVLRISRDGRVLYSNEGGHPLLNLWGAESGEMLPDDWRRFVKEVFESQQPKEQDVVIGARTYSILMTPISESGYLNVYGRDITDRKRAEQGLREALSEVEHLKLRLEAENLYLQEEIKLEHNFEEIISRSESLKKILRKVEQVASTDSTVLILGETGTGKELLARAIHNLSQRRDRPLVKVNCATLPENLIESELFGHERGAFTGAVDRRSGRFELADGGTLFLDEIGELPLPLQAKLLRVLQEGEFERLGSSKTRRVDVRVIAATNHDLEQDASEGQFREDLFYRLNVFPLRNPPLRERKEDIPLLAQHFVSKFAKQMGKEITRIPQPVLKALIAYDWPGNIRELENVLERGSIVSQGDSLERGDWIPRTQEIPGPPGFPTLEELQREHILEALNRTSWRVSGDSGAARLLGLKSTTLEARMKKLNIRRGLT